MLFSVLPYFNKWVKVFLRRDLIQHLFDSDCSFKFQKCFSTFFDLCWKFCLRHRMQVWGQGGGQLENCEIFQKFQFYQGKISFCQPKTFSIEVH